MSTIVDCFPQRHVYQCCVWVINAATVTTSSGYVHMKDSQLFSSDGLVRNYHISALQENVLPRGYYLKHAAQVAPFSN